MATVNENVAKLRYEFLDKFEKESNKDKFHPKDIERIKTVDIWLQCFLKHCEQDVKAALKMLCETCEWRKNFGANDVNEQTINMEYMNAGLSYPKNRDLNGRLIFIFKSKLHFKGLRDHQELLNIFVYWMDRLQRENNYEPITIFFDLAETGISNMDLEYTKSVINMLKFYYPNSVGSILIFEQPWILSAAIKIMKTLLPPKAVQVLKSVTLKNITEFISEDNLLKEWGGSEEYEFKFIPENITNNLDAPTTPIMKKVHFANLSPPETPMSDATTSGNTFSDRSEGTMLRITPNDAIFFVKSGHELVGTVEISNISQTPITYKVKTTSPEKFRVRPSTGILAPGANSAINVVLQQGHQITAVNKDKFLVMCMEIEPDTNTSSQDIADLWKGTQSNSAAVEQHRLKCCQPANGTASAYTDNTKNGGILTGNGLDGDRSMMHFSNTITQLVDTTNRLETQVKMNRTLQWITMALFLFLSIAVVYILKIEIRNSSNGYCSKPAD